MAKSDCIFCQIVSADSPSHQVWEDDHYLAFLSIFPNTEGVTVVIPKAHTPSYIFDNDLPVITGLTAAAKTVAHKIDTTFDDVGRTGVVFEGFGVDHLHAKLFPLHATKSDEWQQRTSSVDKYFDHYEGYVSSHDFTRADDVQLADLAKRLRDA